MLHLSLEAMADREFQNVRNGLRSQVLHTRIRSFGHLGDLDGEVLPERDHETTRNVDI